MPENAINVGDFTHDIFDWEEGVCGRSMRAPAKPSAKNRSSICSVP